MANSSTNPPPKTKVKTKVLERKQRTNKGKQRNTENKGENKGFKAKTKEKQRKTKVANSSTNPPTENKGKTKENKGKQRKTKIQSMRSVLGRGGWMIVPMSVSSCGGEGVRGWGGRWGCSSRDKVDV